MEDRRQSFEEPLLEEKGTWPSAHTSRRKNSLSPSWSHFIGLQALLLILYTTLSYIAIGKRTGSRSADPNFYSPADQAIVPEVKTLRAQLGEKNEFTGNPNPENDAAWSSMFDYANVRVTEDELRRANRSSVQLSDGSGDYLGVLDVFHQLHCVKYIHEYVHQEYYNLKPTAVPFVVHVDHCIEMIRQVIMCKADTSLMTFKWMPDTQMPFPSFEMEHECRSWDSLIEWSKERAIDISDYSILVHPTLGPAFKEAEWNHTKEEQDLRERRERKTGLDNEK